MKSKKFDPIVYIVGMIALFLLQGCDKENEQEPEIPPVNGRPVKLVDINVVIPVHRVQGSDSQSLFRGRGSLSEGATPFGPPRL